MPLGAQYMELKNRQLIVGAKKNPDNSIDYSHAAVLLEPQSENPNMALTENEIKGICQQFLQYTESHKNIRLRQIAKEKQITPEKILEEVRLYSKTKIKEREKGELRHYHRTSIENFRKIAGLGKLLSRSKLRELDPDIKMPGWSSSDDVMMTRDHYDLGGNLTQPGFYEHEVVGASGGGVMLVFQDKIMNRADYDSTRQFPTISELPLEDSCEVILADSDSDKKEIEIILSSNHLNIPVVIKSNWSR